jgi:dihydroorotate dehydrogenase electron transfer subunit
MVQTDAWITGVEMNGPYLRATLAASALHPPLAPGSFVLADLGGYLRTPLFPARLEPGAFDVLAIPAQPAAALQPGTTIDIIGPLGHGFQVPETVRHMVLVASTPYLGALLPLAEQGPERSTTLLLSAPTAADIYPIRLLPPALEVHIVTADGSAGHQGSILDLFPDIVRWADCVCIAGDPATYPALAQIVREARIRPGRRFAQALVAPTIACGVGACRGCAVQVARGVRLACTDGPVFDLLELQ